MSQKIEHQDIRSGLVLDIKFNGSWINDFIEEALKSEYNLNEFEFEFAIHTKDHTISCELMFHEELKNNMGGITDPRFPERFADTICDLATEYYQKGWIISTEN